MPPFASVSQALEALKAGRMIIVVDDEERENEGDLVCDFFLGGFSTAKTAIGLNRRATGFEISTAMFDTRIQEIETLQPGSFLSALRSPAVQPPKNRRKAWTEKDVRYLTREFRKRRARGETKKAIIAALGEALGRGRWAIEKALKKYEITGKLESLR